MFKNGIGHIITPKPNIVSSIFRFLFVFCPLFLNAQPDWEVNPNEFEHSMSITCVVENAQGSFYQENISIAVFDGEICVGVAITDTYFAPINSNLAFLVVYGNQTSATYSIKVLVNDIVIEAGSLSFESNEILGTLDSPFVISPVFIPLIGCMNDGYLEYNPQANSGNQDLLCVTEIVYGCLNDNYVEFSLLANTNDESCLSTWQQAYLSLIEECDTQNLNEIFIDLPEGWSLFGYSMSESLDVIEVTNCISDEIIIIKDYLGSLYYPEYNFNGIGNFEPGLGYQIKLNQAITGFHFCN